MPVESVLTKNELRRTPTPTTEIVGVGAPGPTPGSRELTLGPATSAV